MRGRPWLLFFVSWILVLGLFVFGKVTGGFFAWFLFYFCLVGVLYEWMTVFASLAGARVERTFSSERFTAGQTLHVLVRVRLRGIWPVAWLRVVDRLPANWLLQTEGMNRIRIPLWRRTVTFQYTVKDVPRGVYTFHGTDMLTGDVLGLVPMRKTVEGHARLVVYPKIVPVRMATSASQSELGEARPTHLRTEDSTQVMGVRAYVPGDRMNRIHWKVSARRGELQAKEFELDVTSQWLFIPDNVRASYSDAAHSAGLFELTMSITASLIRHAYETRNKFGLVIPVEPHVAIGAGLDGAFLQRSMEALAALQPTSNRDFPDFIRRVGHQLEAKTICTIVTPHLDERLVAAVSRLRHQGALIQLFVPTLGQELDGRMKALRETLRKSGVSVYFIPSLNALTSGQVHR